MVRSITNLSKNGVKDYLWQRITAIILGVYVIFLLAFTLGAHPLTYAIWHELFSATWMKIFTLLALISLIKHAWVGMWTIFTDYVTCSVIRGILMVVSILLFFSYLVWGIQILWG